jgi:hypothetical protein
VIHSQRPPSESKQSVELPYVGYAPVSSRLISCECACSRCLSSTEVTYV